MKSPPVTSGSEMGDSGDKGGCLSLARCVVSLVVMVLLLATAAVCVLSNQASVFRDATTHLTSPSSELGLAGHEAPTSGWLLFDKMMTDSHSSRDDQTRSPTAAARRLVRGFKWAAGVMLDDFALGMSPDELEDRLGVNDYAGNRPTIGSAAEADKQPAEQDNRLKRTTHLMAQERSSEANEVQLVEPGKANVINSNIGYSKTRRDLRDARAKLERQQLNDVPTSQSWALSGVISPTSSKSECRNESHEMHSSQLELSRENLRENLTAAGRRRQKRRAGANEHGKPILNEFSFPANLVQGMRFVLMCQVLDGEPPVQIKWFKDSQDMEALLQNNGAPQDDQRNPHRANELAAGGASEIGAPASRSINKIATAPGGDMSLDPSATGQASAGQQQDLEHIEMISNDELSSSLLFRKVKQQHGGNYTCLASNRFGSSSYTSLMTVKVPPTWRVEPQDRESIMGEQITIDCQAVGVSSAQINLAANLATNSQIKDPSQAQPQSALAANQQMNAAANPAQVGNSQQQHLLHNFKLINSNHHVQTLENGSLIIRQASKEHEGQYLCEADNGVEPSLVKQIKLIVHKQAHFFDDIQVLVQPSPGQQHDRNYYHQLDVNKGPLQKSAPASAQQQPDQSSPSVKVASLPQNTSLVRLVCAPHGDVPIQVDWLKDGHLIHTHSSDGQNSYGTNSNEPGQSHSNGQPLTSLGPASNPGRFHVSSRWNMHRLSSGGSSGLESELLLANLGRNDAGLYSCSARNAYGQSERKLRLVVQEQPEAPTMVDVARITSRSISLRWLAPFDGHSPIIKYVIEYRRQQQHGPAVNQISDNLPMSRSEKKMPVMQKPDSETNSAPLMESSFAETGPTLRQRLVPTGDMQLGEGVVLESQAQVQHTVHELEPMTSYLMRVIAMNALGQSRPSVALSLRTEEEVPSTIPDQVESVVLSSSSIKLRWSILYSYEHELIDGFFIGYRSFGSSALLTESPITTGLDQSLASNIAGGSGSASNLAIGVGQQKSVDRPTFTYKTIRLINQHTTTGSPDSTSERVVNGDDQQSGSVPLGSDSAAAPVVAPISSITKTVPASSILAATAAGKQYVSASGGQQIKASSAQHQAEMALVVVSSFEFIISGLERNTEYTILIQCFNKKGTGPPSDPVTAKTLQHDPPRRLSLTANELTETSLHLNWHFPSDSIGGRNQLEASPSGHNHHRLSSMDFVDGFVLSYAKIAQPGSNASRHQQQDSSSSSAQSNQNRRLSIGHKQTDSAARISQNPSPTLSTGASFQYNPPIQPNQLLDHKWQAIQLAPQQRDHVLKNLECGTWYAMKIWAFNKVGKGEPSDLVTVSTRGKAPVAPGRSALLVVNSTQVKLNLNTWYDGGCEIEKFNVQFRTRGQQEWMLVSNNIPKEQGVLVVRDLTPATSYELLVGAHNHVNLSEAKYRFTTLDSEGRQVAASKGSSFLPALVDDYNDEANSMLDYSDDNESASSGSNMRRESFGNDFGFASTMTNQRWFVTANHILNSPLTLLFTFCIFLFLLGLLAFHRFNNSAEQRHCRNGPMRNKAAALDCDDDLGGGGGGPTLARHCSLDETATMMDSNEMSGGHGCGRGGPSVSCSANGSSTTSADSPGRMVNVNGAHRTGAQQAAHLDGSSYAPLDCYNSGAYCNVSTGEQAAYGGVASSQAQQQLQRTSLDNNWTNANGMSSYSQAPQQQQQHGGLYAALPNGLYGSSGATRPDASLDHDANQQHLMQMLLIPSAQMHPSETTMATTNQMHGENGFPPSMTTMALATLSRQKAGLLKATNGITQYVNSSHAGPYLTLGRMSTAHNQGCFPAAEPKTNDGHSYQMSLIDTLARKEKALTRAGNRRQDQTDVLYHETSSTNLSTSFASTSGCGTSTGGTSQSATGVGLGSHYSAKKMTEDESRESEQFKGRQGPQRLIPGDNDKRDRSSQYEVPYKYDTNYITSHISVTDQLVDKVFCTTN